MTAIDWNKLAEHFPESEVKQRPGAAKWDHKPNCEGARCREAKDEDKHHQFNYIDARAVAQRLDEVLTPAGWSFVCQHIGEGIVHGRLSIGETVREDHGYPNSERDEEPIKAATSDALKRCAVLFGIGRHLYEDNKPGASRNGSTPRQNAPQRAPAPVAAPASAPSGDEPPWAAPDEGLPAHLQVVNNPAPVPPTEVQTDRPLDPREGFYGPECPKHKGRAWKETQYGPKCTAKDDDGRNGYCIWKPSKRWIAEREMAGVS